jgi:hypothetical protein
MFREFLDKGIPSELDVVRGWVQGVEPRADISGPGGYFGSLNER